MRVSIWRQFSGNHSARFTVVGIFETPEQAQRAATELRRLQQSILDWYTDPQNEAALDAYNQGPVPPSPPEDMFVQTYGLEQGPHSHDWFFNGAQTIAVFDRSVFINATNSEHGSRPVDQLIERLGGRALVDGVVIPVGSHFHGYEGYYRTVTVDLTCMAPNEVVAQQLASDYLTHLATPIRSYPDVSEWDSLLGLPSSRGKLFRGEFTSDGSKLRFQNLEFYYVGHGLSLMVDYLTAEGCSKIEYTIQEHRDPEEDRGTPL